MRTALAPQNDTQNQGQEPPPAPAGDPLDSYYGLTLPHWIQSVSGLGEFVTLEDGSRWRIDPLQRINTLLWLVTEPITVYDNPSGFPPYLWLLHNSSTGETVAAELLWP